MSSSKALRTAVQMQGKMARSEVLHEARVTQCELASAAGSFGT